jgi:N-acetylmuramoyl-L-alanine amidase
MCIATAMLLATMALGSPPPEPATPDAPARHAMRALSVIVIDPGHGGDNRGCLGVDGTWEKEATLDIATRVARMVKDETTARPRLTRRDDRPLGLGERSDLAQRWNADVFLSIHLNADPFGQGSGIETWFLAPADDAEAGRDLVEAEEHAYAEEATVERVGTQAAEEIALDAEIGAARIASQVLAELVVDGLQVQTGARVRGVRQARFGVLKGARMPAIVVECGFFSHAEEGMRLADPSYRERLARGIVDGLIAFDARLGTAEPRAEAAAAPAGWSVTP